MTLIALVAFLFASILSTSCGGYYEEDLPSQAAYEAVAEQTQDAGTTSITFGVTIQ